MNEQRSRTHACEYDYIIGGVHFPANCFSSFHYWISQFPAVLVHGQDKIAGKYLTFRYQTTINTEN